MKHIFIFFLFISSYSFSQSLATNVKRNDIFFSYLSLCNITFEFKGKNKILVNNNGKKFGTLLIKSRIDSGYYNVIYHKKFLWTFNFFEGDVYIANQHYESPCEIGKGIILQKFKSVSDSSLTEFLTDYKYVNTETESINNKAYYLTQIKDYAAALLILNKILEARSDRAVAFLNIADCYWALNKINNARENYKKYYNLMKAQSKDFKRIPSYVLERIK